MPIDAVRRRRAIAGLARNPAAPLPVLLPLLRVPHTASEMATRRGAISDELAEAMVALGDAHVIDLIDREGRASAAFRRRLAESPDRGMFEQRRRQVRAWVAQGAHLPLAWVETLSDKAGHEARMELARDPDPKVRAGIAGVWLDAPDETHRTLLADPDAAVRTAACRSRLAPADLHRQLLSDRATRRSVASYVALDDELATELATDGDEEVRLAAAQNPQLPAFACEILAGEGPMCWGALICNPATPEHLRARLHAELAAIIAAEEGRDIREQSIDAMMAAAELTMADLPWLRRMPLHERLAYLGSPYPVFRRALAWHEDLPADAIDRLQADSDCEVQRRMAKRPDAPGDFVARVLRECGDNPKFGPRLADHPNLTEDAFRSDADHPDPRLRELACRDPLLPAPQVARLARDANRSVRIAAAGHPRLPVEDLLTLLEDTDPYVVEAAAASPNLPAEVMQDIVDRAAPRYGDGSSV